MQGSIFYTFVGLIACCLAQGFGQEEQFSSHLPVDIRCRTDTTNKLQCGVHVPKTCKENWNFKNPCTPENLARNMTLFPHPFSEEKFLMCGDFGKLFVVLCPRYEVFHKGCRQCVARGSKLTAACEAHDVPLSETVTSNPCTTETIIAGKLFFPFPGDLGKYIHCDAWGKAWEMICTPGEVWDVYKVACVNPLLMNPCAHSTQAPGHLFKHPCDPSKFIRCDAELIPYSVPCAANEYFSEINQVCHSAHKYTHLPPNICGLYNFRFRTYSPSAFTAASNKQLITSVQPQIAVANTLGGPAGSELSEIYRVWEDTVSSTGPVSVGAGDIGLQDPTMVNLASTGVSSAVGSGFDMMGPTASGKVIDTGIVVTPGKIDTDAVSRAVASAFDTLSKAQSQGSFDPSQQATSGTMDVASFSTGPFDTMQSSGPGSMDITGSAGVGASQGGFDTSHATSGKMDVASFSTGPFDTMQSSGPGSMDITGSAGVGASQGGFDTSHATSGTMDVASFSTGPFDTMQSSGPGSMDITGSAGLGASQGGFDTSHATSGTMDVASFSTGSFDTMQSSGPGSMDSTGSAGVGASQGGFDTSHATSGTMDVASFSTGPFDTMQSSGPGSMDITGSAGVGASQGGFDTSHATSGTMDVASFSTGQFDTMQSSGSNIGANDFMGGTPTAGGSDFGMASADPGAQRTASLKIVGDFSTTGGNVANGIIDSALASAKIAVDGTTGHTVVVNNVPMETTFTDPTAGGLSSGVEGSITGNDQGVSFISSDPGAAFTLSATSAVSSSQIDPYVTGSSSSFVDPTATSVQSLDQRGSPGVIDMGMTNGGMVDKFATGPEPTTVDATGAMGGGFMDTGAPTGGIVDSVIGMSSADLSAAVNKATHIDTFGIDTGLSGPTTGTGNELTGIDALAKTIGGMIQSGGIPGVEFANSATQSGTSHVSKTPIVEAAAFGPSDTSNLFNGIGPSGTHTLDSNLGAFESNSAFHTGAIDKTISGGTGSTSAVDTRSSLSNIGAVVGDFGIAGQSTFDAFGPTDPGATPTGFGSLGVDSGTGMSSTSDIMGTNTASASAFGIDTSLTSGSSPSSMGVSGAGQDTGLSAAIDATLASLTGAGTSSFGVDQSSTGAFGADQSFGTSGIDTTGTMGSNTMSSNVNQGFVDTSANQGFADTLANQGFVDISSSNQGFAGSPASNQGFVDTLASNQGFVDTSAVNQGFIDTSASNQGFAGSPASNQGFVDTLASNQGFVDTLASNQGFVDTSAVNQGFIDTSASNQGFIDTSASNQGFVDTSANQGFIDTSTNQGFTDTSANQGFADTSTMNQGFVDTSAANQGFVGSSASNQGFVDSSAVNQGYVDTVGGAAIDNTMSAGALGIDASAITQSGVSTGNGIGHTAFELTNAGTGMDAGPGFDTSAGSTFVSSSGTGFDASSSTGISSSIGFDVNSGAQFGGNDFGVSNRGTSSFNSGVSGGIVYEPGMSAAGSASGAGMTSSMMNGGGASSFNSMGSGGIQDVSIHGLSDGRSTFGTTGVGQSRHSTNGGILTNTGNIIQDHGRVGTTFLNADGSVVPAALSTSVAADGSGLVSGGSATGTSGAGMHATGMSNFGSSSMTNTGSGQSIATGSTGFANGANQGAFGAHNTGTPPLHQSLLREYDYSEIPFAEPCTKDNIMNSRTHFRYRNFPHSFIQCNREGSMYVMKCNGDLLFDVATRSCYSKELSGLGALPGRHNTFP